MAKNTVKRPDQPTEPVQRRPMDAFWFVVLFVSVATGLGMTIFAPVGDEPTARSPAGIGSASTLPGPDPFMPATTTAPTTATTTQPATAPAP